MGRRAWPPVPPHLFRRVDVCPASALRQSLAPPECRARLYSIAFSRALAKALQPSSADLLALLPDLCIAVRLHVSDGQEFILHYVDDDGGHDDFHHGAVYRQSAVAAHLYRH